MNTFFEINSDKFLNAARQVIEGLGASFNSHDFIQKFAKENEVAYITWLYNAAQEGKQDVFQFVHQQIGSKLLDYSEDNVLPIRKIGKVPSENVFGCSSLVAKWEKI